MGQAVFDRPWEAVAAIAGGLSRNWVAKEGGRGAAPSSRLVGSNASARRQRASAKMGGHKPKAISGEHGLLAVPADQGRRSHAAWVGWVSRSTIDRLGI